MKSLRMLMEERNLKHAEAKQLEAEADAMEAKAKEKERKAADADIEADQWGKKAGAYGKMYIAATVAGYNAEDTAAAGVASSQKALQDDESALASAIVTSGSLRQQQAELEKRIAAEQAKKDAASQSVYQAQNAVDLARANGQPTGALMADLQSATSAALSAVGGKPPSTSSPRQRENEGADEGVVDLKSSGGIWYTGRKIKYISEEI